MDLPFLVLRTMEGTWMGQRNSLHKCYHCAHCQEDMVSVEEDHSLPPRLEASSSGISVGHAPFLSLVRQSI